MRKKSWREDLARVSKRESWDRVAIEGRKYFVETGRFKEISSGAFLDLDLFVDGGLFGPGRIEVWKALLRMSIA